MSHQLRYTVVGQMSYHFRCIYCISSKMMTHFIKNFIEITFFDPISGFIRIFDKFFSFFIPLRIIAENPENGVERNNREFGVSM